MAFCARTPADATATAAPAANRGMALGYVAFLASPAASFITGANLLVDGALTRGVQF